MRVTATGGIAPSVGCVRTEVPGPVHVVPVLFNIIIYVRVDRLSFPFAVAARLLNSHREMLASLSLDARAMDHVPKVRDDAHLSPKLSIFVEIDSPRIAAAFGKHFKTVASGMITPDAGIHPLPSRFGRARFAHIARTKNAVAAIKPAVRSPSECIEDLVRVGCVIPSIEQNLRITGRLWIVPVVYRHKHQVRRGANPNSPEADLQSADEVQVLHEHSSFVGLMITVGVLENQNAIRAAKNVLQLFWRRLRWVARGFLFGRIAPAPRISESFRHPDAPAMIEAKRDRLHDVGLGGEDVHFESGRQRRLFHGALW